MLPTHPVDPGAKLVDMRRPFRQVCCGNRVETQSDRRQKTTLEQKVLREPVTEES